MSHTWQRGAAAQALHLQLAQRLREQIRLQAMPPGTRLASVRACAREHGVNPQTVVAAYDLLQA
ncbi:MAG: GntR family transcriptional regulator, partial [Betaproteobacteria bacterium]|nr:GntR family transcriptional regulator [Betaproteobacteria bacterium]